MGMDPWTIMVIYESISGEIQQIIFVLEVLNLMIMELFKYSLVLTKWWSYLILDVYKLFSYLDIFLYKIFFGLVDKLCVSY